MIFFPDPDPAKSFWSHRIRINYTDYNAIKVKMLQTFENSPFFVDNYVPISAVMILWSLDGSPPNANQLIYISRHSYFIVKVVL